MSAHTDAVMREFCETVAAIRAGQPDPHANKTRKSTGPWGDDSSFEHPEHHQWTPDQFEAHEQRARDNYAPNWRRS